MNNEIIILTAPTASGKTEILFELAKRFPIEVISADSRQVFKYMDIGTAKITPKENSIVKHHLIDIIYPDEFYSAGKFEEDAINVYNDVIENKKIPILAGGTGFYIKAFVEGIEDDGIDNATKNKFRKQINNWREDFGDEYLKIKLKELDEESYNFYQGQNIRRISRALEFYLINGKSILTQKHFQKENFIPKYHIISTEREMLYNQINERTIEMWENGFEDEVKKLLLMGYGLHNYSINSVGYRECINYFEGEVSREEAIEKMQQYTRNFAKRQLTWLNNQIIDENKIVDNKTSIFEKLCIECENYLEKIS